MANLKVNTVSGIGTEGTVFDGGLHFRSLNYMTLPKGDTTQRGRGRGLWAGGTTGVSSNIIQYAELSSQGNTIDFGDLSAVNDSAMATASATRAVFGGGRNHPSYYNKIDTVEIATTGNATDFGDVTTARGNMSGGMCASTTRGLLSGGYVNPSPYPRVNLIDFITIATTGNSTDFGDLTVTGNGVGANSNTLRGVFAGRVNPSKQQVIDYVDIATTGDARDFGDLLNVFGNLGGTSDSNGGLSE